MLHHPQYRERYAENLKRDLPRIPLLRRKEAYDAVVRIGGLLMDLHVNYEQQQEYPLVAREDPTVPYHLLTRVEKMKLTPDRGSVVVNRGLTLEGIPEAWFQGICVEQRALIGDTPEQMAEFLPETPELVAAGYGSTLCMPIVIGGVSRGTVNLLGDAGIFTPSLLARLDALLPLVALLFTFGEARDP